jgi:hypothetical protein
MPPSAFTNNTIQVSLTASFQQLRPNGEPGQATAPRRRRPKSESVHRFSLTKMPRGHRLVKTLLINRNAKRKTDENNDYD